MCTATTHPTRPGVRCKPGLERLTYSKLVLDQEVKKYKAALATEPEVITQPETETESEEKTLSASWIHKLWQAAVAVQRKFLRMKAARVAVRQARAEAEAERIEALANAEHKRRALQLEKNIRAAYRALDKGSDAIMIAQMDQQLLADDAWPGPIKRREELLKESEKEAKKAQTALNRLEMQYSDLDELTPSQEKKLTTAQNKAAETTALVEHLASSIERAPDARAADWNLARARGDWADLENAVIKAEAEAEAHKASK